MPDPAPEHGTVPPETEVAEHIVTVRFLARVPEEGYKETVAELLGEVERAMQDMGLGYTAPEVAPGDHLECDPDFPYREAGGVSTSA